MSESLFNKVKAQSLQPYYEKTLTHVFSYEIWKKNEEHLFYRTSSMGSHLDVFSEKDHLKRFKKFTEKYQA